jgi:hypothetical protein
MQTEISEADRKRKGGGVSPTMKTRVSEAGTERKGGPLGLGLS